MSDLPQSATAELVTQLLAGRAPVNTLARQHGFELTVVDAGMATPITQPPAARGRPPATLQARKIAYGTRNCLLGPAMSLSQTVAALQASTNRLAVISTDLSAYLRILHMVKPGASQELDRYQAGIDTLNKDIGRHLNTASALVAELRATRRPQ